MTVEIESVFDATGATGYGYRNDVDFGGPARAPRATRRTALMHHLRNGICPVRRLALGRNGSRCYRSAW
jgi:hypothetical protein